MRNDNRRRIERLENLLDMAGVPGDVLARADARLGLLVEVSKRRLDAARAAGWSGEALRDLEARHARHVAERRYAVDLPPEEVRMWALPFEEFLRAMKSISAPGAD
ncbi:MAG: hypothetical protein HY716_17230 [Planctomycetes bacterium]|nr:hypothetical protein [Planctomycetota bacterium]